MPETEHVIKWSLSHVLLHNFICSQVFSRQTFSWHLASTHYESDAVLLLRLYGRYGSCFHGSSSLSQAVKDIAAAAAKSRRSCPTLCDPIDGSPSGSPVPGILQTRTLEWVAISFSNAKWIKCKAMKSESEVAQSSLTLRDPMDRSLPGSSIHGIFQARVLEWGAIAFSD